MLYLGSQGLGLLAMNYIGNKGLWFFSGSLLHPSQMCVVRTTVFLSGIEP
jgi:hypothetical protein